METNSNTILSRIKHEGINVYEASTELEGIELDTLDDFISIAKQLKIEVIFYNVDLFDEFEIDMNLITEEDIPQDYKEWIIDDVKIFNESLEKMREHEGKEVTLKLFFSFQGLIHSLRFTINHLYVEDKEDFLNDLMLEYESKVHEVNLIRFEKNQEILNENLEKLKYILLDDQDFRKCTNKSLRKSYVYDLIVKRSDLTLPGASERYIVDVIEKAWTKIKLAEKS